jgi:hypothetical protein
LPEHRHSRHRPGWRNWCGRSHVWSHMRRARLRPDRDGGRSAARM